MPSSIISLSMANSFYKIFLLIFFCFWASIDAATDTLKQGDMLNSPVPLVSKNGNFNLSFFNLTDRWYLGVSLQNEFIWVANREKPILDDSGVLLIDETGSLLIKHNGGDPIKLFSDQSRTNLTAILQDDGNFVLKETNSDGTADSEPLWQSFDSPTNVLLPGMKLGVNDKTGKNWSLTSWLSYSVPSKGAFTLEWDPSEEMIVIKRRGVDFWTSGKLNGVAFKNLEVFASTGNGNYSFRNYTEQDGKYLNYTFAPSNQQDGNSVTSLWLMTDGSLMDQLTHLSLFGSLLCDGNTKDFGCKSWEKRSCRDGQKLERKTILNYESQVIRVFDNRTNLSLSDCKDMCWKNCTCLGVQEQGPNPNGTGCTFLPGPLKEIKSKGNGVLYSDDFFFIISPVPVLSEKEPIWKWVLIAAAALVVLLLLGFFLLIRWRRVRLEGTEG